MVNKKTALGRFAFTMIELIFAIVVISIAVITLPMMVQITSKGIESNILQEAIFAGSAELMGATSYYWDTNSMLDANFSRLERVIDIANDCDATTNLRPGHVNQPYHRRCLDDNAINPADVNGTFPSLDTAEHASQIMFTDATKDSTGYKDSYNSAIDVTRTGDVKKITVTITDSATPPKAVTALSTYSANIGEIDFYKRRF